MPALPLAGRRIVVTRTPERAGGLMAQLERLGATAISLPTIAFAPPFRAHRVDRAIQRWARFDACIFTSPHAVETWFGRARALGLRLGPPPAWSCAIGPATAAALAQHAGWSASVVPADFHAEGVVAALADVPVRGMRVVVPRAAEGRDVLLNTLNRWGALVERITIYRTVVAEASRTAAQELFPAPPAAAGVDAVIFTSGSTAHALADLLGGDAGERLRPVALGVLGAVTRVALVELGWPVAFQARWATMEAVVAATVEYFAERAP